MKKALSLTLAFALALSLLLALTACIVSVVRTRLIGPALAEFAVLVGRLRVGVSIVVRLVGRPSFSALIGCTERLPYTGAFWFLLVGIGVHN